MKRIRDLMNKTSWGWIVALGMVPAVIGVVKAAASQPERNLYNFDNHVYLYVDPDTGCHYFSYASYGGYMTPRVAADGKTHMGCKGTRQ